MADTNAFNSLPGMAPATATPGPGSRPAAARAQQPAAPDQRPARQAAAPKANPKTAASGVPYTTASGQKQLDGRRTPEMSKPVRKGGLAERTLSPERSSSDRVSGLEAAMGKEADRLHQRSAPKSTRRK